jgi:uncharacterized protein
MSESRPPFPPFTRETAVCRKSAARRTPGIRAIPSGCRSPTRRTELDYRLIKELWAFTENHIAVRFAYEWHDDSGNWFRSYGNEQWEFAENGLMRRRLASINDLPIKEAERKYHWDHSRPRPANHAGLSDLICDRSRPPVGSAFGCTCDRHVQR